MSNADCLLEIEISHTKKLQKLRLSLIELRE